MVKITPVKTRGSTTWFFVVLCVAAVCLLVAACTPRTNEGYEPEYASQPPGGKQALILGVLPYYNPQHLYEDYAPLVAYLNQNLPGIKVELVASRSYEEFEKRLYGRSFHLALANPYEALESLEHGYRLFGKVGDDASFRGVILVRKESGIHTLADLKGKTISFPGPTALAGAMMPLYFLQTHGLDVHRDIHPLFSGSQESSIMNAYLGNSAAGAAFLARWQAFQAEHPGMAAELVAQWETPALVNNALVAREDVPKETLERVAALLFDLQTHAQGLKLLHGIAVTQFERATEETYQPVRDFLKKYREVIH